MPEWEAIENSYDMNQSRKSDKPTLTTERMHIHGGWLVRTIAHDYTGAIAVSVSMVFVPDPAHDWKLS